jgi:hypothetical protein
MDVTQIQHWPRWFYGPQGKSNVFDSVEAVPAGWKDHPSKLSEKDAEKVIQAQPLATAATTAAASQTSNLDAHGWPFDPAMHDASETKTAAGLWKLKPGQSRPDPKPGFPAPVDPSPPVTAA